MSVEINNCCFIDVGLNSGMHVDENGNVLMDGLALISLEYLIDLYLCLGEFDKAMVVYEMICSRKNP